MDNFSLELKLWATGSQEVQELLVDIGTYIDEVELVGLVRGPGTLWTNALLVIETKELKFKACVDLAVHLWHRELKFVAATRLVSTHHTQLLLCCRLDHASLGGRGIILPWTFVVHDWLASTYWGVAPPHLMMLVIVLLVLEIHCIALAPCYYFSISQHALCLHILGTRSDSGPDQHGGSDLVWVLLLLLLLVHHHLVEDVKVCSTCPSNVLRNQGNLVGFEEKRSLRWWSSLVCGGIAAILLLRRFHAIYSNIIHNSIIIEC
jgi:hypothetical protein